MAEHYDTIKDVYEAFNDTEASHNKIVSGKNRVPRHISSLKKIHKKY